MILTIGNVFEMGLYLFGFIAFYGIGMYFGINLYLKYVDRVTNYLKMEKRK